MKTFTLFLALILLSLAVLIYSPNTVYAQDPVVTATLEAPPFPSELPDTAVGFLPYVKELVLFIAGSISVYIIAGVKENVPWLGKQEWFLKLFTELVSGITAAVVGFVVGNVAVALGFLDQSGLWQVIVFSYPAAVGLYHTKKFSSKVAA